MQQESSLNVLALHWQIIIVHICVMQLFSLYILNISTSAMSVRKDPCETKNNLILELFQLL